MSVILIYRIRGKKEKNKCKRGEGVYMVGNAGMELPLIIFH